MFTYKLASCFCSMVRCKFRFSSECCSTMLSGTHSSHLQEIRNTRTWYRLTRSVHQRDTFHPSKEEKEQLSSLFLPVLVVDEVMELDAPQLHLLNLSFVHEVAIETQHCFSDLVLRRDFHHGDNPTSPLVCKWHMSDVMKVVEKCLFPSGGKSARHLSN